MARIRDKQPKKKSKKKTQMGAPSVVEIKEKGPAKGDEQLERAIAQRVEQEEDEKEKIEIKSGKSWVR